MTMPAFDMRQSVWLQNALGFPGRLLGPALAVVLLIHPRAQARRQAHAGPPPAAPALENIETDGWSGFRPEIVGIR